ncbi:hypothetical protein FGIG_01302 [Fasciola gigantica]|uniref:MATH domain-containing protein n=1 Tax=Fasciola gigantica TaxID=46835 RepID=A0A504YYM5_FASGI|nr:hypothetical protein FGIG_01302 [Fasciola gigantica]
MKFQVTGGNKSPAIHLHRVVRVGDKFDTCIFTFVLTPQLTRGFLQSAQSKEFIYGGQKWQIRLEYYSDPLEPLSRRGSFVVHYQKQPLGIVLLSCSLANGTKIELDYVRFTILHQEHFSRNLTREEVGSQFTHVQPFIKVPRWIESGFLSKEHYLFDDCSGMLEVELRGAVTTYEEQLRVPRDSKEAARCRCLESTSFPFAYADWSLSVDWRANSEHSTSQDRDLRPSLTMQRHGRTKHWTRVRFRAHITWHDFGTTKTGVLDQLLSPESGAATNLVPIGDRKWFASTGGPILSPKTRILVRVEFFVAVPISRVDLIPTEPQGGKNCSRVSDPLGFDWIVMSDILGSFVKLRVFPDSENLVAPKKTDAESALPTRSTSFGVQLIPYETSMAIVRSTKSFYTCTVPLVGKSITDNRLDCGDISSEVVLMLDVDKVCSSDYGYSRPTDNGITLRIEWLHISVLSRGDNQIYDDLENLQRYQMLQELRCKSSGEKYAQFSTKGESSRDGRLSVQYSDESTPGLLFRARTPIDDEPSAPRDSPKASARQTSDTRSSPFGERTDRQPGPFVHRRSHQSELMTERHHTSSFRTPPIYVDNSPECNGSHSRSLTPTATPSWRRHSSCLEAVGSSQQRTRRRLPSPPTSAVPLIADGHLSVDVCNSPNYVSTPRLSTRGSFDRHVN